MRIDSGTQRKISERFRTPLLHIGAIDEQRDAGADGLTQVSRRRCEFLRGLPVQESESVQLGPGTAAYASQRIGGRDLVILSYSVAPKLAIHTVLKKDWVMLLMPLNRRSELSFNACVARSFDVFLSAGHDGYVTTGKDRRNVAIGIRKSCLISACSALAGVGEEDVTLRDLVLPREQGIGQRLRQALVGLAAQCCQEPLLEGQFAMPEALENDLISMLAARLVPAVRGVPEVNLFRVDALRVVRAATAVLKTKPAASLADLCAGAGVSQRWLHKCFTDVFGVSPYRYVWHARLSRAHNLLLGCSKEAQMPLVKGAALSLGYRVSGRFAEAYRSVFVENPSDTLQGSWRNRCRRGASCGAKRIPVGGPGCMGDDR